MIGLVGGLGGEVGPFLYFFRYLDLLVNAILKPTAPKSLEISLPVHLDIS